MPVDRLYACSRELRKKEAAALRTIEAFLKDGPAYVGVSWGKDSVVVAHMARHFAGDLQLWSVRGEPLTTPECDAVRDAFLAMYTGISYTEEIVWCRHDAAGWHATGTLEAGFARVVERSGTDRYLSGVRGEESSNRKRCMMRFGEATERTCRPLGHWTALDVFGYLRKYDLPTHPNYAMSMCGALQREHLRVAWLTLRHGRGVGRYQWERAYYRDDVEAIERGELPSWHTAR